MLKFFRKIRKNFIANSNFSRYSLYAIGEIILVVIGILIALQVNNWNESKKEKEKEIRLLIELKNDLLETKSDLITDVEKANQILETTNVLYKAASENKISDNNPFELKTAYLLETSLLYPKLSAYEAIKSEGITIISNDILRKKITDFYQLHLTRVSSAEVYLERLNNDLLKPYLNKHSNHGTLCVDCLDLYDLYKNNQGPQMNIYFITYGDNELIHMLKEKFNVLRALNQRYENLSQNIDEIIELVDQESKYE